MRVLRHWKGGLALVIGLCVLAAVLYPRIVGPKVVVRRAERRELVQSVVTTGRVLPPAEIKLAALVSGNVSSVNAGAGQSVTKGAVLVELDSREARASLGQARASLARANAEKRHVSSVSAKVLDQSVAQSKARLDDASRRHADNQALASTGAIAKAELDRSATELSLARSEYASAQARAKATEPGGAETATASAAIALAAAEVRAAEVRLDRTKLLSPVDGVVLERNVEPGDTVQPGTTLLLIAQTGMEELVVEPDEKNLALVALGQPAVASTEAFPDRIFPAKVSFIAPAVDPKRGTIEVRLEVREPPKYLRPSMTVSVEIEVARKPDALVVDADWVRGLASEAPWLMVVRDGRAERANVVLGLRGDERVEISSGIAIETPIIAPTERSVGIGSRVRLGGP